MQPFWLPFSAFARSSAWLRLGADVIQAVDAYRALRRLGVATTQQGPKVRVRAHFTAGCAQDGRKDVCAAEQHSVNVMPMTRSCSRRFMVTVLLG